MNKKGFTLIELLSTLAIMSVITTFVTFNIINIFENKKKIQEESINNIIIKAADVYINLKENKQLKNICITNGCTIKIDTLIKEGLLNEEDVDNTKVINIYYENKKQKYKIS